MRSGAAAPPGIARQIAAEGGRVTFARFMDLALTHPREGYYAGVENLLGPRGHFSTVPALSPEFNATVARLVEELVLALLASPSDRAAARAEELAPSLSVVELGGGEGHSAVAVLARLAQARCDLKGHITYTMVEIGSGLMARQRSALAGPLAQGWRVGWVPGLTDALAVAKSEPVVVLGNEFLDALPVHLVDVRGDTPREAWVESDGDAQNAGRAGVEAGPVASARATRGGASGWREVWDVLAPEASEELRALFGTEDTATLRKCTRDGYIELRPAVGEIMRRLWAAVSGCCLLTVDYGEWFGTQGEAAAHGAPPPEGRATGPTSAHSTMYRRTLRGYCRHQSVSDLYARVGAQDLTADVDFRALDLHGRAAGFETVLYTTVGAMLRGDRGAQRLGMLDDQAGGSLEADRRATVLRALLDDQDVGGAFKVMLQVKG